MHAQIGFGLSQGVLYAPSLPVLCMTFACQPVHIPAGHVLHTDQQEGGDVEHGDVRSPPRTAQEGKAERNSKETLAHHPPPAPATVTQQAPTINCPLESITPAGLIDLLPFLFKGLGGRRRRRWSYHSWSLASMPNCDRHHVFFCAISKARLCGYVVREYHRFCS